MRRKQFEYTPPQDFEEFKKMYEKDHYPKKITHAEILSAYNWYMLGRLDGALVFGQMQLEV